MKTKHIVSRKHMHTKPLKAGSVVTSDAAAEIHLTDVRYNDAMMSPSTVTIAIHSQGFESTDLREAAKFFTRVADALDNYGEF